MDKRLNTSFHDKKFENIHTLKSLPWVGKNYQSTGLLIIGEAAENGADDKQYTRNAILDYFKNKKHIIFENVNRALFVEEYPSEEQEKSLWKSIAFYNFFQHGTVEEKRLNNEDFDKEWETFFEVINVLKPKRCLFFGVRAIERYGIFQHHCKKNNYTLIEEKNKPDKIGNTKPKMLHIKNKKGRKCSFLFIEEPSLFFSWKRWGMLIRDELGEIRKEIPPSLVFVHQRLFMRYAF